jgi:Uma2 family endonuclease
VGFPVQVTVQVTAPPTGPPSPSPVPGTAPAVVPVTRPTGGVTVRFSGRPTFPEPAEDPPSRRYPPPVSEARAWETPPGGIAVPVGGWTVEQLDTWPESHTRYELTDGALTVSPSPSSLHQAVSGRLYALLDDVASADLAVTQAVEIRLGRQLTRIPDLLVVRSDDPARHWFAPAEVLLAVEIESPGSHAEDRITKPALYARHGIPHFWRVELEPIAVRQYRLGSGETYREAGSSDERLAATEPFPVDVALADLLPRWAR